MPQFDNDTRFQGPHQHRDVVSRVMRLCLSLGVTPVFAPLREHGFRTPSRVSMDVGKRKSGAASTMSPWPPCVPSRRASSERRGCAAPLGLAAAPPRPTIPATWQLDLQALPSGRLVFLRRTNDASAVTLLGHTFPLDSLWPHRLVRCEVQLDLGRIHFYRLRRQQPQDQPLICEHPYALPRRRFKE